MAPAREETKGKKEREEGSDARLHLVPIASGFGGFN